MSRQFFARLMLALATDMVFYAAFGRGIEAFLFAAFSGAWAGAGGRDDE